MNRLYRWCLLALLWGLVIEGRAESPLSAEKLSPEEAARRVDELLGKETGHRWAEPAEETILLRRIFLDLVGQPPTPDDILAYLVDDDPDKYVRTIQSLLRDPDYGRNWARYWRDVIMARRSEQRAFIVEPALEEYLATAFQENRSWRSIATDFITAEGDVQENGATAIILAQAGKPEETVAELSRIFCGIQIQCAQCHDHPTDRWTREQFHQLAAFFPRVAVRPGNRDGQRTFVVNVIDREFRFRRRRPNNNRFRGTLEHRMPNLQKPNEPGTLMQPVFFVNHGSVPIGTRDAERRSALAEYMTGPDNPWFAKAFVNRMWSELVGHGFYEPIDDMGPEREARAPETLEFLSQAFVASGHDVAWLLETILRTRTYRQASLAVKSCNDCTPAILAPQRLRSDVLLQALNVALDTSLEQLAVGRTRLPGPRANAVRRLFRSQFGYDPSDPRLEVQDSISQALAMMNAPAVARLARAYPGSSLARILAANSDDGDAIEALYLRVLSRFPTNAEVTRALTHIRQSQRRDEGFEDLQWALLNSTEFRFRR